MSSHWKERISYSEFVLVKIFPKMPEFRVIKLRSLKFTTFEVLHLVKFLSVFNVFKRSTSEVFYMCFEASIRVKFKTIVVHLAAIYNFAEEIESIRETDQKSRSSEVTVYHFSKIQHLEIF